MDCEVVSVRTIITETGVGGLYYWSCGQTQNRSKLSQEPGTGNEKTGTKLANQD